MDPATFGPLSTCGSLPENENGPKSSRALSLIAVLVIAKALAIAGRDLPGSIWMLPALVWHDVAVGAAFWAIDRLLGRPRLMWAPYAMIAAYAAINVPVTRVLSSPLTIPMWRAARGPLTDSIASYVTATNLTLIAVVLGVAVAAPMLISRLPHIFRFALVAVAAIVLAIGPLALRHVDTLGLHRNAITALVATSFPRLAAQPATGDWRSSPAGDRTGEDLTRYRGRMAGQNVVIVILESTAAQYLASYGAKDDPTPTLSALARQSIVFDNAYAAYPESIKGLFALLCSRSPAFDVAAEVHATAPCDSLPHLLGAAGYRSALFHSGRFVYLGMSDVLARQGFDTLEDAGVVGGNLKSSFGVDEPSVVRRMLGWIDALPAGQKFLVVYAPVAGHHPYVSPETGPFDTRDELGVYKNALHYGDQALGSLLDGLRARHLGDRTLVILFGDHGEAFNQHAGNYGHSLFIYEENIRVPLVVSMPGLASGMRVRRTASVIDITPTILDLLGLPAAPRHEGASLLVPRDRMALFYTDYSIGWLGLRDGCWKFIHEVESKRSRLYDVCVDPEEIVDRSGGDPTLVEAYRDRLERWSAAQRAAITAPAR
jgi:glucan phosphoethanolaminetransferase (alkaline phosphatase superfamily)